MTPGYYSNRQVIIPLKVCFGVFFPFLINSYCFSSFLSFHSLSSSGHFPLAPLSLLCPLFLSSSLLLLFISRLRCSLLCLLITLFYLFSSAPYSSLHLPFLFFLHASSFCPYLIFTSFNSLSPVLPLSPHLSYASPLLHLTIFYCYHYHLPLMLLFFFSSPQQ